MDEALLSERWVGRIFSSWYVSLLPQIPLNSQTCSWFVHMKVAFDLVEWADVCPTTCCVSEIGSSSVSCTLAAPFVGTGLASGQGKPSEMLMGWLTPSDPFQWAQIRIKVQSTRGSGWQQWDLLTFSRSAALLLESGVEM